MDNRILIIIGVILIGGYFAYSGGYLDDFVGGKKITCEVSVENPYLQRTEITSGPKCFVGGTYSVTKPFALTDDNDISLTLSVGGKSTTITDRIDEGETKTFKLTLRVDESVNSGTMRLSDLKGDIETRTISF